jgi:hypothetical protein
MKGVSVGLASELHAVRCTNARYVPAQSLHIWALHMWWRHGRMHGASSTAAMQTCKSLPRFAPDRDFSWCGAQKQTALLNFPGIQDLAFCICSSRRSLGCLWGLQTALPCLLNIPYMMDADYLSTARNSATDGVDHGGLFQRRHHLPGLQHQSHSSL